MNLEIHDTAPKHWDGFVVNMGGTIYHSTTYALYYKSATPNAIPIYFILKNQGGEVLGLALGFHLKIENKLGRLISKRLYFPSFPLFDSFTEKAISYMMFEIERFAYRKQCLELSIGSFASKGEEIRIGDNHFQLTNRFEFDLDLTQNKEALTRGLERKRRKNINKAKRLGVSVINADNEDGIKYLRLLQAESSQRIVNRGGPSIIKNYLPGQDPIHILLKSGHAKIFCAMVEGNVVSSGLFTFYNGIVYHTLSGHNRVALESQASTFLLWHVINQYHDLGAKVFNFGGCKASAKNDNDPEHGVYSYKMGFGARRILCQDSFKVLHPFKKFCYDLVCKGANLLSS